MKLVQIDLKKLVAIGQEENRLALLVNQGDKIEYLEFAAPKTVYRTLQKIADIVNKENELSEPIAMLPVNSTMAVSMGYDRARQILQIEFVNGSVYQYSDVEEETWKRLCESNSKGNFFNREIKGIYASQRVDNTKN